MLAGYNRWAYQNDVTATFPWSAADFNKDGLLDTADLTAFQAGWLMHAALGSNTTFARGDIDLDGDTDIDDFVLVRQAFQLGGQLQVLQDFSRTLAVPEPRAAVLTIGAGLCQLGLTRGARPGSRACRDNTTPCLAEGP